MRIVIDANVFISMLIRPGKPIEIFFSKDLDIFAPQLLFTEIQQNIETITKKSNLTKEEIDNFIKIIQNNVHIISEKEFLSKRKKAQNICPDPKDITYFALALHLHCGIWTNEKKLAEQKYISIFKTHELIKLFPKK